MNHNSILSEPPAVAGGPIDNLSAPPGAASGPISHLAVNEQAGYTLVALLALMTVVALFAMAAAPSILQQAQREKEKEAIFRGEEVADAIRLFHNSQAPRRGGGGSAAMPTSMEQLLEG